MAATLPFEELLQEALRLPLEERSWMASRLIESLDDDVTISPAWQSVIQRRLEAVRQGTLRTAPHEEVMDEAREMLAAIRQQKQSV